MSAGLLSGRGAAALGGWALLASSLALAAPPPAPKRASAGGKAVAPTKATARPPAAYRASAHRWHEAPAGAAAPRDEQGRPRLVLVSINSGERAELTAETDGGGFDAAALDRAARVVRDTRHDLEHPLDPSLLDLVYQVQRHFGAPEVRVVSGYRAPPPGRRRSNHGKGRALDVVVPGVRDVELSAWARTLGQVGVGLYPNSGFCHLDVREQSYFWVDRSGPGQRRREVPVGKKEAAKADAEALKRPPTRGALPFVLPSGSVREAWQGRAAAAAGGDEPEHDDDDAAPESGR